MEDVVIDAAFWRGKRVLVTGHTGFKGAWLSLWLQHLGAVVTGFALTPPTKPCMFEVAQVASNMTTVLGDVRERAALSAVLANAEPEVVFHLAAQSLVRESYAAPVETFETNVMGTVNLLDALRRTPSAGAAVLVTSDKCYDNKEWPWGYRESDPMGGHDPYSSSKGCSELVIAAFRDSFFSATDTARALAISSAPAGNVIGGGDWATDRLVPDTLKAFGEGRAVHIRHPGAVRPWQHVLEPLAGYLLLAQHLLGPDENYAGAWNFGPSDSDNKTVGEIVERLGKLWPGSHGMTLDRAPQPHEAHFLKLDCSKARSRLHWTPRWNLDTALTRVVAWHQAYLAGRNMHEFSLQQIDEYSI
jgi:CDP-glucose 4,6-dehydratase